MNGSKQTKWYSVRREHEGFPLFLRYPEKPDFDALQGGYPQLLIVTHVFSKAKPNGVPEPDYNDSLMDFDCELRATLEEGAAGVSVLIETFGGRRMYYVYLSPSAPLENAKVRISEKYPEHALKWDLRQNPSWDFIRRYSAEFDLYPSS
jgi:hypothetical protein